LSLFAIKTLTSCAGEGGSHVLGREKGTRTEARSRPAKCDIIPHEGGGAGFLSQDRKREETVLRKNDLLMLECPSLPGRRGKGPPGGEKGKLPGFQKGRPTVPICWGKRHHRSTVLGVEYTCRPRGEGGDGPESPETCYSLKKRLYRRGRRKKKIYASDAPRVAEGGKENISPGDKKRGVIYCRSLIRKKGSRTGGEAPKKKKKKKTVMSLAPTPDRKEEEERGQAVYGKIARRS